MARIILMTDFSEAYARRLIQGVVQFAQEQKETWVVSRLDANIKHTAGLCNIVNYAKSTHVDVIIGQFDYSDNLNLILDEGIKVIAQDYKVRFDNIPNITANHIVAGSMGADYFIKKGFRSFGFYGPRDVVFSEERCQGFTETVKKSVPNASISALLVCSSLNLMYDLDELCEWLIYLPKPVAIMASDDNWAYNITQACHVLRHKYSSDGFRIPEDIAVLGVDNDEAICKLSSPNLSSLDQDIETAGYEVAAMIRKMLKNPDFQLHNLYVKPTNILTRQSSDILVNDDPHIAKVLRFIHENLSRKLLVDEIVDQVPLSRRLLETRFRANMGTSIYNYIKNVRVDKMSELLKSGKSVSEAAYDIGFDDVKNISRIFKSIKGVSPSDYYNSKKNQ